MEPAEPVVEPKPYFSLDLREQPSRSSLAPHDRFSGCTGQLELEIQVVSAYLHVGSGVTRVDAADRAYAAFVRRDGELIIPGSSIKGVVRSIVEAISNSCVRLVTRAEQAPSSHRACATIRPGQEQKATLCPACSLFGATGYRGRVHFADARPVSQVSTSIVKIAELWEPRRATGRKFYHVKQFRPLDDRPEMNHRFVEAVPRRARFSTVLTFENTTSAEMGLLIRALGIERDLQRPGIGTFIFTPKLGGGKPRCLGAVRFVPRALRTVDPGAGKLIPSLVAGGRTRSLGSVFDRWLSDDRLLDRQAWEDFTRQMKATDAICPTGLY
jgi:CRISPR/Cas system CSM-associated protein Csm3 (group 7 of RAMP superfamily)